ncbi:MAG: hypothetical protein QXX84_08350 [Sulfolobales archaeon]
MKDLKNCEPLESYFLHRLWFRCAVIRQTTGLRGESAIKAVNIPCIVGGMQTNATQTEQYIMPQPPTYHVVIPAAFRDVTTGDIVRLMWGPDGDIYEGDTLFVWGLPFLLQVRELRNPLTVFSHFELNCTVRAGYHFRTFSDFAYPPTSYTYIEPPQDIVDVARQVLAELENLNSA